MSPRGKWGQATFRLGKAACPLFLIGVFALVITADSTLHAPTPSRLILDRRGDYLGEVPGDGESLGFWPPPEALPERIVRATLETEDRSFYEHRGVHLPSAARAVKQNLSAGRIVSGASTLAMQVARMQAGPGGRNLWRKLREAVEAMLLVHEHGHDRVLRQYLTLAPYGHRVRGVSRAARLYFAKPVEDLSWMQAAWLAGLPQSPGRMDPWEERGLQRGLKRAHRILRTLHARGLITRDELEQAVGSELGLVEKPRRRPEALHAVLEWSRRAGAREEPVLESTLDLSMQSTAAEILRRNLARNASLGAGNTAGIVVDRHTGEILAYVGSSDYFSEETRGAIDYVRTRRSPGSTLKPFIYALGMERRGYTAATQLPDTPLDVEQDDGRVYLPENINHAFLGPLLLRNALGNSRNIPALRALSDVGVEPLLRLLERGGVEYIDWTPGAYGLGLAIGNLPVTLEELVALYGVLANEGEHLPLRRFTRHPAQPRERLFSRASAQTITHVLSDPLARRPSFPAGSALDFDYAVAVKTGTSQGYRDAWTVAYSDRLIVGVWVGNHDWRRMNHVGGLGGAADAVHEIMDALMPLHSPHVPVEHTFPIPDGHVSREICPLSGALAGPDCPHRRVEAFPSEVVPSEPCHWHAQVTIDVRNGLRANPACPERFVRRRAMMDLPPELHRWARGQRLEVAPIETSPLCPGRGHGPGTAAPSARIEITEPRNRSRYLLDPDAPTGFSSVRLAADVTPATEEIVWIVDGVPVARVGHPYEYRWSLSPGVHTITAAMIRRGETSAPITLIVAD